jgi:hypothetical protein
MLRYPGLVPANVVVDSRDRAPGNQIIELPGEAGDFCLAASGRVIALPLKGMRQIAIVDQAAGAIVRYLPADDAEVMVAGGATKLVVLLRTKGILQVWDLGSWRRITSAFVEPGQVDGMVLGCASEGPLCLAMPRLDFNRQEMHEPWFYELPDCKRIPGTTLSAFELKDACSPRMVASPDGGLFVNAGRRLAPAVSLRFSGGRISRAAFSAAPALLPSFDGSRLLSHSGVLDRNLQPVAPWPAVAEEESDGPRTVLPAVDGPYFLSWTKRADDVTLHRFDAPEIGVAVPGLRGGEFFTDRASRGNNHPTTALSLASRAVVRLSESRTYLVVRRLDAEAEYAARRDMVPRIVSRPPTGVNDDANLSYRVETEPAAKVTVMLEDPDGARTLPDGLFTVPNHRLSEKQNRYIIAARDEAGNVALQWFDLKSRPPNRP